MTTTTIDIKAVNCIKCGLPNGEAETRPGEPCHGCRVRASRDESKGEGEERSFWRFWKRSSPTRSGGSREGV